MDAVLWLAIVTITRVAERSWLTPASLLALSLGGSAVGGAVFAPEYYSSRSANLVLQMAVVLVLLGSVAGRALPGPHRVRPALVVTRWRLFLTMGFAGGGLFLLATLHGVGLQVASLLRPADLISSAQRATYSRYTEGLDFPIYYNIAGATVLLYAAVLAAHCVSLRRISIVGTVPIVFYILGNMLITTRAPLLFLAMVVLLSAAYAEGLERGSGGRVLFRSVGAKAGALGAAGALVVAGLFFYAQLLRFGAGSERSAGDVWNHLRRWPFGNLPSFAIWFDSGRVSTEQHAPGFYTFMGIFDNLGLEERVTGGYSEYLMLAPGETSNVYTVFRGMMHDFGFLGAGIAIVAIGLLAGACTGKGFFGPRVAMGLYVGIGAFCLAAPAISFWAFTSNILAVMSIAPALKYFCRPSHSEGHDLGESSDSRDNRVRQLSRL